MALHSQGLERGREMILIAKVKEEIAIEMEMLAKFNEMSDIRMGVIEHRWKIKKMRIKMTRMESEEMDALGELGMLRLRGKMDRMMYIMHRKGKLWSRMLWQLREEVDIYEDRVDKEVERRWLREEG